MQETQTFRELTYTKRPQDPHGDGTGLRFETGEYGGDYPDNMPQTITMTDAQGRWAVYVPLRVGEKIVVPDNRAQRIGYIKDGLQLWARGPLERLMPYNDE